MSRRAKLCTSRRSVSAVTTSLRCRLIDRKIGGVLLNLPLRQRRGGRDLLLCSCENLLLLFFDAGLDALLVERGVLLGLGAHSGDLFIQLAQTLFNAAQARARLFGRRPCIDQVLLDGVVAITEGLRQGLEQKPAYEHGQNDES